MIKLYGTIALLLVLCLLGWGIGTWDNNRLAEAYDKGVQAERAEWMTAVNEAKDKDIAKANTNTLTSESTADQARAKASDTMAASTAANHVTVEKIADAYKAAPPIARCLDTGPQPLPAGVLEGLSEARSAALDRTPAASGGLQPTKRSGPSTASSTG